MNPTPTESWNPDRRWADPFIATLALLLALLLGGQAQLRRQRVLPPATRVSLQGRLQDLGLAAPRLLGPGGATALLGQTLAKAAKDSAPGWDRALLAVHAGEAGDTPLGLTLAQSAPGPLGESFLQTWRWSYLGIGPRPGAETLPPIQAALGGGYAAQILAARALARNGGDPQPLEAAARRWTTPRVAMLGAASMAGFLLALGGLGFGCYLAFSQRRPQALPSYHLSGRAVLIVLLGWFLTLLSAGPVVGILVSLFPGLRPFALPLVYALHAGLGTSYLCRAEGVTLATLWRRLLPGQPGRTVASALGFFALAFAAVLAVSLLLAPLLRGESPQKDLLELLAKLQGPLAVTLTFLVVAVLAPAFEELLFRGFLLPWLGPRLEARLGHRSGWLLAVAITALAFGAMHMQPLGLPTLSTLGFVLGLAYLRTGTLGSAILVHGIWNGSVFILMRLLAN